ncbi:hypothetical protein BDM02DRAFT_3108414 [Thelephora ganbajun]|uniref:Uncharacterized protein n=1 Tax=Thelephora ganbajun TaxID=370292 RepID=A0ACB6ZUA4_THEGA|nr:hypothetical protein BDM02DRAFT_3108414 [Thelephora ganbajun]
MDVSADQDDWSAFETAPVLGHETYDEQPANAPPLVRAETIPHRATTPLKQATPNRSPTPPTLQQVTVNLAQPSLVGMTKEEKAAEMNRRKEERKQRIAQLKAQKVFGGKA